MATYLQGVTDYIPQFQPFQPDLNFYSNIMQTKQSQYDTNWKALNKMYSAYYNADLTREPNVAKKDQHIKDIEFNLKRVSQLDLSLEQNLTQATQVFTGFYEDKDLMKDMAWTKNYNREVGRAESLQNAYDDKMSGKYWADGVSALRYKKEEFKEATDADALDFQNVAYTPYVNTIELAQDIAKEAGLSIESVKFSEDAQHRWIIKTKNGQQLVEPLSNLFESRLGNDAKVQAVYQTQAYVNRKDYAQSNAAQFNGDKNLAEMKYLENSFNTLKANNIKRNKKLRESSVGYSDKMKDLEKQIKDGDASPEAKEALEGYKENKDIVDKILERSDAEIKLLNGGQSSTTTTTTGFVNPYGDLKSLRYKVDNGVASSLMKKDLDEAANIFAYKDMKTDIDANPYAVNEQKHMFSMQQVAARNAGLANAARIRNEGEAKNTLNAARIAAETHYLDEQTGEVKPYEIYSQMFAEKTDDASTSKAHVKNINNQVIAMNTKNVAIPYLDNTLKLMEKLIATKGMTEQEATNILGYAKNPSITRKQFRDKLDAYGNQWVSGSLGSKSLDNIENRMSAWMKGNAQLKGLTSTEYSSYRKSAMVFDDYALGLKANVDWNIKASKETRSELERQGLKGASLAYDEKGNFVTRDEYYKKLVSSKLLSKAEVDELKYIKDRTARENARSGASSIMMKNKTSFLTGLFIKGADFASKVGPGNWINQAVESNLLKKYDYDALQAAASAVYTSGKIKTDIPGLGKLGTMTGSGKFVPNINSIIVNPKGHTQTNVWAGQVMRDLDKVDWGDNTKNRVSFSGFTPDAWNKAGAQGGDRADAAITLMRAMQMEERKPKSKMSQYQISVSPVANGSMSKSAVIIRPDMEWLKTQVYTTNNDGKRTGAGTISADQYAYIGKHGINWMTDANNMSNQMYTSAFQSPLASYVDSRGTEGYTYTDPVDDRYQYKITKSESGNDYNTTLIVPMYNPNTKSYEPMPIFDNTTIQGNNLEENRYQAVTDGFDYYKQLNKDTYNGRY
jgi:hypothetical protein